MYEPVIILGAARSGTKILRDLLAASPECVAVPYDINFVWRRGQEAHPDDALQPGQLSRSEIGQIRDEITRLARKSDGAAAPTVRLMVEKTVANPLRVPFVDEIFPEAQFVNLVRDGRDVTESAYRLWQSPPDFGYLVRKLAFTSTSNVRYLTRFAGNFVVGLAQGRGARIWGPRYPGIEQDLASADLASVCARQWACTVRAADDGLSMIPEARQLTAYYEDIVGDETEIVRLCTAIGITDPEPVLRRYREDIRRDTGGKWQEAFDEATRARLWPILEPELARHGYLG